MSLTNPAAKMSKSENGDTGRVTLMDDPNVIMKQFKRAVTDSDTEKCVRYDPENKPGVANLMTITDDEIRENGEKFTTINPYYRNRLGRDHIVDDIMYSVNITEGLDAPA